VDRVVETERLILRTWEKEDAEIYSRITQCSKVMEFLCGNSLSVEQVEDFILRENNCQSECGYALWAAELKETGELIGFIGLSYVDWENHFTPAMDVGWILGSQYWGKGYATEGASASLNYGFNELRLEEIVSFTAFANVRSIRVMERIGMIRDFDGDFAHPKLEPEHRLSKHALYRIRA